MPVGFIPIHSVSSEEAMVVLGFPSTAVPGYSQWVRGTGNKEGSTLCSMALPPLWAGAWGSQHKQVRRSTGCCKHPFIIVPFHSGLFLCCIWVKSYTKSLSTDLFTACQMRRKNLLLAQCLKFKSSDSKSSMQPLKQPLLRPGRLKALHF